jgi:hypothetical protein
MLTTEDPSSVRLEESRFMRQIGRVQAYTASQYRTRELK